MNSTMYNNLIARVSSLLEEEDPLVNELIIDTIRQVEGDYLSIETHARKIERMLDRKLKNQEGEEG